MMKANREYKSTLFSGLFNDVDNLRELYNAIADTNYDKNTPIEINTLEDVLIKGLKNDLSFTIDNKFVVLIEHQSTINNNMPLRCLMYIARIYEKITYGDDIYNEALIHIPTPEIIVLYNGKKAFPKERTLRLSDAFLASDESQSKFGSLELTVRVVNINPGFNNDLLQKSKILSDYTAYIQYLNSLNPTEETLSDDIKKTTKWSLSQNILKKFLTEHETEVTSMLMTEYSLDRALELKDAIIAEKDTEIAENRAEIAKQAKENEELKNQLAELKAKNGGQ